MDIAYLLAVSADVFFTLGAIVLMPVQDKGIQNTNKARSWSKLNKAMYNTLT